jgi:hypothetical protein
MELHTAKHVQRILNDANGRLNDALLVVKEDCSVEEFEGYRTKIGQIMGAIIVDLLQPIYVQHPDAVPPELKS